MGLYFPILIEPKEPEPFAYDRELVVVLSDWSFLSPETMLGKLKKSGGYFNLQRRTLVEFFSDVSKDGFKATLDERSMWAKMRMDPTDFADVTGVAYTYLVNGMSPDANWTGLFTPGEKVRLRFINSCAMTIMTVRIPGLKMNVVQVDGQNVVPVEADEFRIAPAETYDMIVEPEDRAYTIFSENLGRSGYARATLAPRAGMSAPVPEMRSRPIRTMADMGMEMSAMGGMKSMDMGAKASEVNHTMADGSVMAGAMKPGMPDMGRSQGMEGSGMKMGDMTGPTQEVGGMAIPGVRVLVPDGSHYMPPGMEMPAMKTRGMQGMDMRGAPMPDKSKMPAMPGMTTTSSPPMQMNEMKMEGMVPALPPGTLDTRVYMHGPDGHGVGSAGLPMSVRNRMGEPGIGLENTDTKVLVYTDLKRLEATEDMRVPTREVELHITGNMERYMWGFDGKKYSEAGPVRFESGERVRFILVNDTMMEHPIHLHGMWMELENGAIGHLPRKHTVLVKPAERLPVLITADAPGRWAMHCHLLLHMEMGMFRVVEVSEKGASINVPNETSGDPRDIRDNIITNRLAAMKFYGDKNV